MIDYSFWLGCLAAFTIGYCVRAWHYLPRVAGIPDVYHEYIRDLHDKIAKLESRKYSPKLIEVIDPRKPR